MGHIVIFLQIITLTAGVWAAVVIFHLHRRTDQRYLKHLFVYIICFNGFVFFYLATTYLCTNLLGFDFWSSHPLYVVLGTPLDLALGIGLAWTLLRTVLTLQERTFSRLHKIAFITAGVIIAFGYGFGVAEFLQTDRVLWILRLNSVTGLAVVAAIIGALLGMLFGRSKMGDSRYRGVNRRFASLFLTGYGLFLFGAFIPDSYDLLYASMVFLFLNLCPVIWYRVSYRKTGIHSLAAASHRERLNSIVAQFEVSKRERDILELIMEGKSNKEIEANLFISINTVKNHIYSLYRKLGVKSRGQLLRLILENDAGDPHSGALNA